MAATLIFKFENTDDLNRAFTIRDAINGALEKISGERIQELRHRLMLMPHAIWSGGNGLYLVFNRPVLFTTREQSPTSPFLQEKFSKDNIVQAMRELGTYGCWCEWTDKYMWWTRNDIWWPSMLVDPSFWN